MAPATTLGSRAHRSRSAARRMPARPAPREAAGPSGGQAAEQPAQSAKEADDKSPERTRAIPGLSRWSRRRRSTTQPAYIRSLANMRGRNVEWAEKAVREARQPVGGPRRCDCKVIDAHRRAICRDLLTKVDGRKVCASARRNTPDHQAPCTLVKSSSPTGAPQLAGRSSYRSQRRAYVLMLIGIYGLLFEFYKPRRRAARRGRERSACCSALYAFQVLPVNYAGLGAHRCSASADGRGGLRPELRRARRRRPDRLRPRLHHPDRYRVRRASPSPGQSIGAIAAWRRPALLPRCIGWLIGARQPPGRQRRGADDRQRAAESLDGHERHGRVAAARRALARAQRRRRSPPAQRVRGDATSTACTVDGANRDAMSGRSTS